MSNIALESKPRQPFYSNSDAKGKSNNRDLLVMALESGKPLTNKQKKLLPNHTEIKEYL